MLEADRAVARIVNFSQRARWYTPWDAAPVAESSGSGFVVEGGLVMTNAHVVADARVLLMYLHGDPEPHPVTVAAVGHDCDLALLRPEDPAALEGRPPLAFGGLPRMGSTVETLGYPVGGRQLSSTRGVVSRIELQRYSHPSNEVHLCVQTDAAINPGNSGGPVLQDGKVVGVAFQASANLQSVGYFIPTEVVHHFRVDAAGPTYRGFPSLGARTQPMESPAARRAAGMAPRETGVQVDVVFPDTTADGWLREGDVILAVDGLPVANDGTVELPPHPAVPATDGHDRLRVDLLGLVDRHQLGDTLSLRVLRDGERLELSRPLVPWEAQKRHGAQFDRRPRYFVYGGLVFVPLDLEMLRTFGNDWQQRADKVLLYEFQERPYADLDLWRREVVVILRRLDHAVNIGAYWHTNLVVELVDGEPVEGLADLVARVESHQGPYHVFTCAGDRLVVLEREACLRANDEILAAYGVPADRHL